MKRRIATISSMWLVLITLTMLNMGGTCPGVDPIFRGGGNTGGGNSGGGNSGSGMPSDDFWTTPEGSTTDYSFANTPIPAGFFGTGSDAFAGTVNLMGSALDSDNLGPADTIIRRLEDKCPTDVGDSVTVDVEIVALSLVSVEPITVTFDDGQTLEFDVQVCLSNLPQQTGTMTITLDEADCGTFDTMISVTPKFTFINSLTRAGQFVDCGEADQFCDPLELTGTDNGWALIDGPGGYKSSDNGIVSIPAGMSFDSNCDGQMDGMTMAQSTCFQPGVACKNGGFECTFNDEAEGRLDGDGGGQHQSFLNSDEDRDSDGWPNDCDNCPDMASPDQTDSDEDGLGDICDNCVDDENADQADADGDEVGDVCDNCPDDANADQADADGNGVGDVCEGTVDPWVAALGTYSLEGTCTESAVMVTLAMVNDSLVLQGFPENEDISLDCNDAIATGSNVTAFGNIGHDVTITIQSDGTSTFDLLQPDTQGSCSSTLIKQ